MFTFFVTFLFTNNNQIWIFSISSGIVIFLLVSSFLVVLVVLINVTLVMISNRFVSHFLN